MSEPLRNNGAHQPNPSLHRELDHWKRMLKALPDVRVEKIRESRSALHQHGYEDDRIVDETVRRLIAELDTPGISVGC